MSTKTLFGTDGVRGVANVDLTPEMALGLARAAGEGCSGVAVVGRDTRRSGQMLAAAVHAGFQASGLDTIDLGIVPVGAVSHLTVDLRAAFGVMVSASHNPAADNGIKFFGPDGAKLDDEAEASIESRYRHLPPVGPRSGADLGIQSSMPAGVAGYLDAIAGLSEFALNGLEVALDCANGASFLAAPALFKRLGADVTAFATEPSGMNINDGCGATHPDRLASMAGGRIGLSFDGDADRLIAVDENGEVVNGDAIMAILARHLKGRDRLP
ncbi:MAG: phosphoglucosamine mutase, partial [Actinomycetota bacterium]